MVQRTGVRGIRQTGRSAQGVTVMNVRDDDRVSAVALVVESEAPTSAVVAGEAIAPLGADGDGAGLDPIGSDASDGAGLDPMGADADDDDLELEGPDLDIEDTDDGVV